MSTSSMPSWAGRRGRQAASAALVAFAVTAVAACGSSGDGSKDAVGSGSGSSANAGPAQSKDPALAAMLPKDIASAGTLNVAISLAYKPMEYSDPGSTELKGADIDLAKAVGAKLGVKTEFQNVQFEQLMPSTTTHRANMIWTAFSDLTKRQSALDFIDYFKTGDQFFVPKSLADSIKTPADLCGKTVAVATGTAWIQTVKDVSAAECAGKAPIAQVVVPSLSEELLQIQQGRAQASMIGMEGVGDLQAAQPGKWGKVGEPYNTGYYGVGFAKGQSQLRDAVLAALKALQQDGTYVNILKKYGLESSAVPAFTLNQGK
ncbi:ABC transporter substrate-binding protein [Streptomyces sp. NPDC002513]